MPSSTGARRSPCASDAELGRAELEVDDCGLGVGEGPWRGRPAPATSGSSPWRSARRSSGPSWRSPTGPRAGRGSASSGPTGPTARRPRALGPRRHDGRAPPPIRVAIVDDHPVVRDGMAALLREYPGIEIAGTAASLDLAEPLLDPALVDVLLLDIRLGEETGFQLLERHRDAARRPAVVVLTAFAQAEYAAAADRLGAAALVLKTAPMPELVAAIRAAALGERVDAAPGRRATDPTLTTREQEIVRLVVDGRSNDEIGAALAIATKTVEGHLRRVFERLGIESRAELSARAVAEGWLEVPTVARRRRLGPRCW